MDIGDICNYYGGLQVEEKDGKFYWGIEDWDGIGWSEIPERLYRALVQYEVERENK